MIIIIINIIVIIIFIIILCKWFPHELNFFSIVQVIYF